MPQHLQPPSLYLVTSREVSSLLLTSCRSLDSELEMEQEMDRSVAILNRRDTRFRTYYDFTSHIFCILFLGLHCPLIDIDS